MPDHSPISLWFWQGITALSPQQIAQYQQCLSCSEREFLSAISAQRRRLEYIVGHYLLRQMLCHVAPHWAPDIRVEHHRGQAPFLTGLNAERINFSLSHSGNAVCCVVAQDCPLGLDIERPRRRKYGEIADAYFAPVETEQLARMPVEEQGAEFYRLWTLKESLLKAKGDNLNDENLVVTFRPATDVADNFWHCYSFKIPPFSFALTLSQALSETLHVHIYCPDTSPHRILQPETHLFTPRI